jgi:hypothetical protein
MAGTDPATIVVPVPIVAPAPATVEEVVFDTLPDNVKKFIDQERTKASKTSRDKALKDALNDPDIVKAISTKIQEEATLTAEQKLSQREKAAALKENRMEAREILVASGIVSKEEQDKVLNLIVGDKLEETVERATTFVTLFNATVASETERKTKGLLKDTPKPQTSPTTVKPFKDMGFGEREELKAKDPARYEMELAKTRSRI